jgi:hypothetical protein
MWQNRKTLSKDAQKAAVLTSPAPARQDALFRSARPQRVREVGVEIKAERRFDLLNLSLNPPFMPTDLFSNLLE